MSTIFWGRSTIDLSYVVRDFPAENDKIFSERFILQPGGPALNAAITFSLLGGKATLISCFGRNEIASLIKTEIIEKYGLSVVDLAEGMPYDFPVSSIIVNQITGTRTIFNSSKQEVSGNSYTVDFERIAAPDIVLLDGFNLTGNLQFVSNWKIKGSVVVLDGGSWKDISGDLLPCVDIAICSNRFRIPGLSKEETIQRMHSAGVDAVAFTMEGEPIEFSEKGRLRIIPVPRIKAVDTLGAGDVLHGAFCYFYKQNKNLVEAIERAATIASESCKHYGTHAWAKE